MASERLEAIIRAKQNMDRTMRSAARGVRKARDAMAEAAASATQASTSMDIVEEEAEDVGDETGRAARQTNSFSRAIQGLGASVAGVLPGLTALNHQIDETGDDALAASAKNTALSGALLAMGSSSGAAASAITALNTSLTGTAVVAGTALAAISALGAAVGGLAVAAGGAAAGLAAIFGGGLLARGEELAAQSSEIEGALGGVKKILSQVGEAAQRALAPLKQPAFEEFAIGVLEGAVTLLNLAAESVARVSKPLMAMADTVSAAFWDQTPEFFAQLEATVVSLLPVLENIGTGLAGAIPDALGVLRNTATKLAPALGGVVSEASDLLPPLVSIGTTIVRALAPALQAALAVLDPVLRGLAGVLDLASPLLTAVQSVADAFSGFTDAVGGAATAFTDFVGKITTGPLASLAGGVGYVIGLVEKLVGGLKVAYDFLSDIKSSINPLNLPLVDLYTDVQSDVFGGGGGGDGGGSPTSGAQQRPAFKERLAQITSDTRVTNVEIGNIDASGSGETATNVERAAERAAIRAIREERKRESGFQS
jgi:phage-related protein